MAASVEEFVELLSSEQHVDITRLRHLSRHGIHPAVRGEVWMYLLGVLSSDKSQEMTSVRSLYNTYDSLLSDRQKPGAFPQDLTALIHREAERIWYTRVPWSYVSSNAVPSANAGNTKAHSEDAHPSEAGSNGNPQDWRRTRQGGFASHNALFTTTRPHRRIPTVQPMDLSHLVPPKPNERTSAHSEQAETCHAGTHSAASSTPFAPTESEFDRQLASLKSHFIRRISNVVSVWIRKKALEKRDRAEADRLRDRLMQERHRQQDDQHSQPSDEEDSKSDSTHRGNGDSLVDRQQSAPSQPPSQPPFHLTSDSSLSSASSSSSASPLVSPQPQLLSPNAPPSSTVATLEDALRPRNTTSSSLPNDTGDVFSSSNSSLENATDTDQSEGLTGSPDELLAFDPAMGMGVDDAAVDDLDEGGLEQGADDLEYAHAHSYPRSHGSSSHSRTHSGHLRSRPMSRVTSKRNTPRMGGTKELLRDDCEEFPSDAEVGEGSPGKSQHTGLGIQHDLLSPHPASALDGRPVSFKHSHSPSVSRPHSPHVRGYSSGYASPSRHSPSSPRPHTPHSRGSPRPLSRSKYKRHGSDIGFGDDDEGNQGDNIHNAGSPSSLHSSSSSSSSSSQSHSSPSSASDPDLDAIQRSLWKPHLVELASPFVVVSGKRRVEAGIFFGFDRLMSLIESHRSQYPLAHQLASFHSLLRRTLPDLRSYFDDEGLDVTPFVKGWLESLFSGQMKLTDGGCLRLWDAYFSTPPPSSSSPSSSASPHPLNIHVYVCLAILLDCKDTLEELDKSECQSFLHTLPDLQVERILNEAMNLRLGHRQARARAGVGVGVGIPGGGREGGRNNADLDAAIDLSTDGGVGLGDIGDVDLDLERELSEDKEASRVGANVDDDEDDEQDNDDSGSDGETDSPSPRAPITDDHQAPRFTLKHEA